MWIANRWKEYRLLDASGGEKLENWGGYTLIRPDPAVIWFTEKKNKFWKTPDAHYFRSSNGGGKWQIFNLPKNWKIHYELGKDAPKIKSCLMTFHLKLFAFKHTGVFPEQAVNWDFIYATISERILKNRRLGNDSPVSVLNLFAYTGGSTMAAAMAGANVVHIDASKGIVAWAKENAAFSGLFDAPIRWLNDDCRKFVVRERRRKRKYDAIIMDPPSYGRGPKGEIWKLEDDIFSFIRLCAPLLSDDPLFVMVNSYTSGLSSGVMKAMLDLIFSGGKSEARDLGLPMYDSAIVLPEGSASRYIF